MTRPGFKSNLLRRAGTATLALPALLLAIFQGPAWLTAAIVAVAVLLALQEFFRMLEARAIRPLRFTGLLLTAAFFLEASLLVGWERAPLLPMAALILLIATLLRKGELADAVQSAAGTLLGAVYLGGLGGTIAALRLVEPDSDGPWRLTLLLGAIMGSDTAAFFVGHAIGRHRLAPTISPGKTVEGALGGLAGGVLAASCVRALGLAGLPLSHSLVLGAAVALFGILGDLAESLLKRWAGVKDSGALFPGHGGMLDRIDSLLFGAPVLYYYLLYAR